MFIFKKYILILASATRHFPKQLNSCNIVRLICMAATLRFSQLKRFSGLDLKIGPKMK